MKHSIGPFLILIFLASFLAKAQEELVPGFEMVIKNKVPASPVKDQAETGTCWSFATSSFIESEAIRMGKGEHDVSEMFFVRQTFPIKADHYVRRHGKANFGAGSLSHDVLIASGMFGAVPEEVYSGLADGESAHDHTELDEVLKGFLDALIGDGEIELSSKWRGAYAAILDSYLGELPATFDYRGKNYNPKTFVKEVLGFEPGNYLEITSFTHKPYHTWFILDIPDNWANASYYNVPLNEFEEILDYALNNGFSVAWDGDVSEQEFSHQKGIALVPAKRGAGSSAESKQLNSSYEKEITPENRQALYESYSTTDDHLMHVIGTVNDRYGNKFYLTKNSWGSSNKLGGYLYMSRSYVLLKSISIMVHKDAIPADIAKKLKVD